MKYKILKYVCPLIILQQLSAGAPPNYWVPYLGSYIFFQRGCSSVGALVLTLLKYCTSNKNMNLDFPFKTNILEVVKQGLKKLHFKVRAHSSG